MKEVIEYYNNGQDEYYIVGIYLETSSCISIEKKTAIKFKNGKPAYYRKSTSTNIGFYEWLFNPKYKVFEVFEKNKGDGHYDFGYFNWVRDIKEKVIETSLEEKIIDYLKKQIGE